jgi:hypothetical protein
MKKIYFLSIFALAMFLLGPQAMGQPQPPPPPEVIIEGMIYSEATNTGILGLTVRLLPPQAVGSRQLVLRTDNSGYFRLQDPQENYYRGPSLLEVYDGPILLFQREFDTSLPQFRRIRIPIR